MISYGGIKIRTGCTRNFFEIGTTGHIVYVPFEKSGLCVLADADSNSEYMQHENGRTSMDESSCLHRRWCAEANEADGICPFMHAVVVALDISPRSTQRRPISIALRVAAAMQIQ